MKPDSRGDTLREFLDQEEGVSSQSSKKWADELVLFCELEELFALYCNYAYPADAPQAYCSILALDIHTQLFGVASTLLKRRTRDAFLLARRSIESAAIAQRLSEHNELVEVFLEGLPNLYEVKHPRQFRRSSRFTEEFKVWKCLQNVGDIGSFLNGAYEMLSVYATHVNRTLLEELAKSDYDESSGMINMEVIQSSDKKVTIAWHYLMIIYGQMLELFSLLPIRFEDEKNRQVLKKRIESFADGVRRAWKARAGDTGAEPLDALIPEEE